MSKRICIEGEEFEELFGGFGFAEYEVQKSKLESLAMMLRAGEALPKMEGDFDYISWSWETFLALQRFRSYFGKAAFVEEFDVKFPDKKSWGKLVEEMRAGVISDEDFVKLMMENITVKGPWDTGVTFAVIPYSKPLDVQAGSSNSFKFDPTNSKSKPIAYVHVNSVGISKEGLVREMAQRLKSMSNIAMKTGEKDFAVRFPMQSGSLMCADISESVLQEMLPCSTFRYMVVDLYKGGPFMPKVQEFSDELKRVVKEVFGADSFVRITKEFVSQGKKPRGQRVAKAEGRMNLDLEENGQNQNRGQRSAKAGGQMNLD